MSCKENKQRINSYEKNVELAQICATEEKKCYIVRSDNNGKTWRFEPENEYVQVIRPKRAKRQ